jgi:hypothetical protein
MNEITNHYVRSAVRTHLKPHTISHEELNDLFRGAGWIGKRREPHPWLKMVPFLDKGPGLGR